MTEKNASHITPQKLSHVSYRGWGVLLIINLFYGFQFFLRSSPNAMKGYLMSSFLIDVQLFGLFTSAYYWTYSLLQIPIGIFLDMYGPKNILRWGMLLCVMGALLFAYAPVFSVAIIGRCLIGAGAAVSFIGSVRMNTLWVPPSSLAFIIGLLSSSGKIGGACANAVLPKWISVAPSLHHVLWVLTLVGGLLTILFWMFGKNGPKDAFHKKDPLSIKDLRSTLYHLLTSPLIWKLGIYGYAMYLALSVFTDGYSIAFLQKSLEVPHEMAENLASLTPLGSCCGAAIISFFSDYMQKRKVFLCGAAILTLMWSSLIFFCHGLPIWMAGTALFFFGFFSGGQILIFAVAAQNFPPRCAGIAVGIVNSILMAGGALHNPMVGSILKYLGDDSLLSYRIAFSTLSLFFLCAVLFSFFLSETYPKKLSSDMFTK